MKILYKNIIIKSVSKDTIARADDVFVYIDSYFKNYDIDKKSQKTEETKVAVLEMEKDGTFKEIFDSMSKETDSLCLTQAQIIEFVKNEKDKLRDDGYGTFFLFKVGEDFFVAYVYVVGGRLRVNAARLSDGSVWDARYRHRIVCPQVALTNDSSALCNLVSLPDLLEINGTKYKKYE